MWGGRPKGKDFLAYLLILISFKVVDLIDTEQAPIEKQDAEDDKVPLDADGNPHGAVRRSLEEWDSPQQLSREAWEGDSYNSYPGHGLQVGYRKVPAADIINPRGQIKCAFPGEMFYFWEVDVRCAICVCLISSEGVKPVCVGCSTCIRGHPIIPPTPPHSTPFPTIATSPYSPYTTEQWFTTEWPPETTPTPFHWETTTDWTPWPSTTLPPWTETWQTETWPTFPPTYPPTPPQIQTSTQRPHDIIPTHKSCRPLPENQPFVNPMNPCQKCICSIVKDTFGADVVSITCEEIPECHHHPATTQAPPDACQNMPMNVWFPHPYYYDEICICTTTEDMRLHIENIRIMCVKIPDQPTSPHGIVTTRPPFTRPTQTEWPTPPPEWPTTPPSFPTEPPFTWPTPPPQIITSTYRPPPSTPKPVFPPNHKSCKPYRPNVPFDHPWDSCQKCVCREFQDQNSIYVEVDCYTKQECCIEIPFGTERYQIEHFPKHKGDISVPDQLCEGKPVGAVFPFPGDNCYSCVCYLDGSFIYPACKRKHTQACAKGQGNIQIIPQDITYGHSEAHAQANAESWNYGGQGQAHAQGQAVAQGQGQAAAQAQAQAQAAAAQLAQAQAQAKALAGTNGYQTQPYWYNGNGKKPRHYVVPGQSQSEAQASANANAQNYNGLYGESAANANAQAIANQYGRPNYGAAQSAASADANAQNIAYLNNYGPRPGRVYSRDIAKANAHADAGSGSQAAADASAEAQSAQGNYPGYGGWAQGHGKANALGYNRPGRLSSREVANAQADAAAASQYGSSQAKADASAEAESLNYPGYGYGQAHGNANAVGWNRPGGHLSSRDVAYANANANANADAAASAEASADSLAVQNRHPIYPFNGRPAQNAAPWGSANSASQAHADAHAAAHSNQYVRPLNSEEHSVYQDGSRCQYEGDKYTERCSACVCYKSLTSGQLYARCTGRPCE